MGISMASQGRIGKSHAMMICQLNAFPPDEKPDVAESAICIRNLGSRLCCRASAMYTTMASQDPAGDCELLNCHDATETYLCTLFRCSIFQRNCWLTALVLKASCS